MKTYQAIKNKRLKWAATQGLNVDEKGYTCRLEDNLYTPFSEQTEQEFRKGKGDELGVDGKPGKMQALHSSSTLVVNVFEYWNNMIPNQCTIMYNR